MERVVLMETTAGSCPLQIVNSSDSTWRHKKLVVRLVFFPEGIELRVQEGAHKTRRNAFLLWRDVLGAAKPSDTSTKGPRRHSFQLNIGGFELFACLPKDKTLQWRSREEFLTHKQKPSKHTKPKARVLHKWSFRVHQQSITMATNFTNEIDRLITTIKRCADPRTDVTEICNPEAAMDDSSLQPPSTRRFYVLVNPISGAGNAEKLWNRTILPVMQQSGIEHEVVITSKQFHATKLMQSLPLNHYDCVVVIGGDGLVSEVVQGLMNRKDWKQAIQQPLGIIPGGSGNGLSCSLLSRIGERFDGLNAIYSIVKGTIQPMDIATTTTGDHVMYSFLSCEWAFIADVDIDSEAYRMFGGLRFALCAVYRLLFKHKAQQGKLRYYVGPDRLQDHHHNVNDDQEQDQGLTKPRCHYLDSTDPSHWKEIEGGFDLFWSMNVTHAASDARLAPDAEMDDGTIQMVFIQQQNNKKLRFLRFLKIMLAMETGDHLRDPLVQLIRTKAFELTAANGSDRICIDGELVPGASTKVEMHQGLARVLCLPSDQNTGMASAA